MFNQPPTLNLCRSRDEGFPSFSTALCDPLEASPEKGHKDAQRDGHLSKGGRLGELELSLEQPEEKAPGRPQSPFPC